jgi:hypothetical protein
LTSSDAIYAREVMSAHGRSPAATQGRHGDAAATGNPLFWLAGECLVGAALFWSENYNLCTSIEMPYKPGVGLERKSGAK